MKFKLAKALPIPCTLVFFYLILLRPSRKSPVPQKRVYNVSSIECYRGIKYSKNSLKHKPINPFWTIDRMSLPKDVQKWWLSIQPRAKSLNLFETLNAIFKAGVPQQRNITNLEDKHKTCAVVGNSPILINSSYGKVIDSHDTLIRFNNAITKGYERDVGSRTTYQMVYPDSVVPLQQSTSLVLIAFKPHDLSWLLENVTKEGYEPAFNKSLVALLHPVFMRYVYKDCLDQFGVQPSTGILGVIMAVQLCDKVDVYGFGADSNGGWTHYFEKLSKNAANAFRKLGTHDAEVEKQLLLKLDRDNTIKLHTSSISEESLSTTLLQ